MGVPPQCVNTCACVNIYSCSSSVEGGLEKVSQRGEGEDGEILFIEELFPAREERRVDRFVTIHYTICSKYKYSANSNTI